MNDVSPFDDFWEASNLDRFNVAHFARQLNTYDSDNKELLLEYPAATQKLPLPRTRLNTLAKKRRSDRTFSESDRPLTVKELGRLFSSFHAWNGLEHRGFPSAGATYVTEIFACVFSADSFGGTMLYYDPERHGVVVVSEKAPSWREASESLNITITGTPQLLILFVMFPGRATAKYGERGGRFALIEIGAAVQQLSLQIAGSKHLKGVAVGGALDAVWKQHLNLAHTDARIALGYLAGR